MTTLGRYELCERLGMGGMAEVFLAYRRGTRRPQPVVIKRMLPHIAADEHFVTMFRDEAAIAARVCHDSVCKVYELGEADGQPFIVMEYLRGVSLVELMRKHAAMRSKVDQRLAAALIAEAAEGLHAVHCVRDEEGNPAGIIHRDVSLSNLFVTVNGGVKILDFGIAKAKWQSAVTQAGMVKGKYAYMSPEQLLGRPIDVRSDLFSLGTVAFTLFTGTHPFRRSTEYETIKAVVSGDAPDPAAHRPELVPEIAEVIARAHAVDPRQRFADAMQLRGALVWAAAPLGEPMQRHELGAVIRRLFAAELRASRERLLGAKTTVMPRRRPSASAPQPVVAPDLGAHLSLWQRRDEPLLPPLPVVDHTPREAEPVEQAAEPDELEAEPVEQAAERRSSAVARQQTVAKAPLPRKGRATRPRISLLRILAGVLMVSFVGAAAGAGVLHKHGLLFGSSTSHPSPAAVSPPSAPAAPEVSPLQPGPPVEATAPYAITSRQTAAPPFPHMRGAGDHWTPACHSGGWCPPHRSEAALQRDR